MPLYHTSILVNRQPDILIVNDNLGSSLEHTECCVPAGIIRTPSGLTFSTCPLIFHKQVPYIGFTITW